MREWDKHEDSLISTRKEKKGRENVVCVRKNRKRECVYEREREREINR